MKFAFQFPGQGSQSLGMLSELAARFPVVEEIFERASQVLHYDVWALTQAGPEEKLHQTEFTQPALLAADFAVWTCWKSLGGPDPQMLAGHSLGEYVAYVVAESMTLEAAIELVALRGRAMQAAVPDGEGAMGAIIALDGEAVLTICEKAAQGDVLAPANFNSLGQTVIAGQSDAIDRALVLAKEAGAKMAKRISVSVPSHCELMRPAAEQMAEKLKTVEIQLPKIPVISNVDVNSPAETDHIRDTLVAQLVCPVRWVETVLYLQEQGMALFVECGPGKVLTGLNKRITKITPTHIINTPDSLQSVIDLVKEIV